MFVETILVHLPTYAELAHAAGLVPPLTVPQYASTVALVPP